MRITPPFLDGAFLALSAMPDVAAVIDSPRCEMERAFKHDSVHDRRSLLTGDGPYARNRRVFAIDWREGRHVTGTEERLRETIVRVAERRPGKPIVVLRGFMSLFIHTDLLGIAASLEGELSGPLLVVEQVSPDDDWVDGWQKVHQAVVEHLTRDGGGAQGMVTGFCVHRLEGDELGNVAEVRRLWSALDLPEPGWAMQGAPLAEARAVCPSAPRFAFGDTPDELLVGADTVPLDLPLGFDATASCLRALAAHAGQPDAAEAIIERERARLREALLPAASRTLPGKGAVVVGDPTRAAALAGALGELGVDVPLVAALRREDGDLSALAAAEERGAEVMAYPDGQEVQERLIAGAQSGEFHVVVGSGLLRDAAHLAGLAYVEAGMPYCLEHFAAPTPFMGFDGLVRLADRLDSAIARADYHARRSGRSA